MNKDTVRRPRGAPFFSCQMEINIETIVEQVIAEKQSKGKAPADCNLHDIFRSIEDDIKKEMRQLIVSGKYQGAITINKVPVLRRKE